MIYMLLQIFDEILYLQKSLMWFVCLKNYLQDFVFWKATDQILFCVFKKFWWDLVFSKNTDAILQELSIVLEQGNMPWP